MSQPKDNDIKNPNGAYHMYETLYNQKYSVIGDCVEFDTRAFGMALFGMIGHSSVEKSSVSGIGLGWPNVIHNNSTRLIKRPAMAPYKWIEQRIRIFDKEMSLSSRNYPLISS